MEETIFRKLRRALRELLKDYPLGIAYGKIEYFINARGKPIDLLIEHEIIEKLSKKEIDKLPIKEEEKRQLWYRLKPRGVDLAISMINLDYGERVLKYAKETREFNIRIIRLTIFLTVIGLLTIFLNILQFVFN